MILPHLKVLKLNGSYIKSIRDIGTSFRNLEALYISRCNITDLSGIICFTKLTELYASYNNIAELSPLADLQKLMILDLEGNDITKKKELKQLLYIRSLFSLNILHNPVNKAHTW